MERTIGRGQFGKVKLAYHKKVPDMKVSLGKYGQEKTRKQHNKQKISAVYLFIVGFEGKFWERRNRGGLMS